MYYTYCCALCNQYVVRTAEQYALRTAVQYVLYVLLLVRTALTADVRTYIYIEGKVLLKVGTYCTYILYARTAPTEVRTVCTYC